MTQRGQAWGPEDINAAMNRQSKDRSADVHSRPNLQFQGLGIRNQVRLSKV